MPTVPLVEAQSAIVSTTARSVGSTGLTSLNRLDKGLRGAPSALGLYSLGLPQARS